MKDSYQSLSTGLLFPLPYRKEPRALMRRKLLKIKLDYVPFEAKSVAMRPALICSFWSIFEIPPDRVRFFGRHYLTFSAWIHLCEPGDPFTEGINDPFTKAFGKKVFSFTEEFSDIFLKSDLENIGYKLDVGRQWSRHSQGVHGSPVPKVQEWLDAQAT